MGVTVHENILQAYGLTDAGIELVQIGSGHINSTYLLTRLDNGEKYILQSINTNVFQNPDAIADNIQYVGQYLKKNYPDYLFPVPVTTTSGETMVNHEGKYWRLSPFVDHSVALDTLKETKQAYEAAKQFAKLSRFLDGFDTQKLTPSIVGFHDLALRYQQFEDAWNNTSPTFKESATTEIALAFLHQNILKQFLSVKDNADFPDRVMHHDTKISNVLLAEETFDGVCVIDLDTLMPGKFISDLGDMMRTYLCEFSEAETDLNKITIRIPYFTAMIEGYLSEMGDILTPTEKGLILYSGKYIVYMQALRFLSDYLNGSIYYPIKYKAQNLDRAKNQFKLLQELIDQEEKLQGIIDQALSKTDNQTSTG